MTYWQHFRSLLQFTLKCSNSTVRRDLIALYYISVRGSTYQLISLIDGKNTAVEAVLQVYAELSQQRNELFALVLHAGEGNGYLVIV